MDNEADQLNTIAAWAVALMEQLGVVGAALAIALENLFPPIPSEVILPLAGFTASHGRFGIVEVLVATTIGSLAGALALYGIGALLGRDRLRAIVARLPLLKLSDVDRAEGWFARYGSLAVFLGRMVPIVRSLISIPAGVERMGLVRFVVLTTLGSGLWNTVFVVAGYTLGENWGVVESYADVFQKLVIGVVVVAVVVFVIRRLRAGAGRSARVGQKTMSE